MPVFLQQRLHRLRGSRYDMAELIDRRSARRCTYISLSSEADLLEIPHVHKADLPRTGEEVTSSTPHHSYVDWRGPLGVQLYG